MELKVETVARAADVTAAAWDACAGNRNPFVRHAFIRLLEDTGCAVPAEGWTPTHLVARRGGDVVGVAPAYFKTHSWGEYVFDQAWANAAGQVGVKYYPKLLGAVPFTPATGPRLLVAPGEDATTVKAALAKGFLELAERKRLSGAHVNFVDEADRDVLAGKGFLQRDGVQFFWTNQGHKGWEAYVQSLNSRKRKMVRKERAAVTEQGYTVRMVPGTEVTPEQWRFFHRAYVATSDRKWGGAYLNEAFFQGLGAAMPEHTFLCLGFKDGAPVAGALHLLGEDTLFGRQWGAVGEHAFLHFECCYYQAVEFALVRGLKRVEAGAQGTHKISRGYLPHTTWSMHHLTHPRLQEAVGSFLERERAAVAANMEELADLGPFRQPD